ncbi:hypothetical protein PAI11_26130 [Patulibacter medicamentivorans]|uniref:Uncharacterized protein n=1 Tax=Patulibacter medicamentivorans TaxID=1097667 RepID=H0E711_9ACTN|nr:hypothetical protein [Patulibacter medicamentivorans]EHN10506.1 hypothetical protein PAI11_26130 [Patulibacter medicamentivorans]
MSIAKTLEQIKRTLISMDRRLEVHVDLLAATVPALQRQGEVLGRNTAALERHTTVLERQVERSNMLTQAVLRALERWDEPRRS